jgi:hypothetical protein
MKVSDDQSGKLKIGQEAVDFPINDDSSLMDLKGSPIFLVFWKIL